MSTEITADQYTCAYACAECYANKNIRKCSTSTNGCKCRGADKLTDYD